MKILIAKANQDIFLKFDKNIKFKESSLNTCTFNLTNDKFFKLKSWLRERGYNCYSLMYW